VPETAQSRLIISKKANIQLKALRKADCQNSFTQRKEEIAGILAEETNFELTSILACNRHPFSFSRYVTAHDS
jgi:hypothetical protein